MRRARAAGGAGLCHTGAPCPASPTSVSPRARTRASSSRPRSRASASSPRSAEIRSFGLHTLLSERNRRVCRDAGLDYTVHGPFGYIGIADVDRSRAAGGARRAPPPPRGERRASALACTWCTPTGGPTTTPPRPARGRGPGRRVRGATGAAGRVRRGDRRGEHAGRRALALHAPRRPRPAGPGPAPRRGSRQHQRLPRRVARRTRGRRCATCTCTPTPARATTPTRTCPWAPAWWTRRPCWPPRGPPAPPWCSSTPATRDVVASVDHLRRTGLLG